MSPFSKLDNYRKPNPPLVNKPIINSSHPNTSSSEPSNNHVQQPDSVHPFPSPVNSKIFPRHVRDVPKTPQYNMKNTKAISSPPHVQGRPLIFAAMTSVGEEPHSLPPIPLQAPE